jgi:hypothetical protein
VWRGGGEPRPWADTLAELLSPVQERSPMGGGVMGGGVMGGGAMGGGAMGGGPFG